jgi:hypothetical protein
VGGNPISRIDPMGLNPTMCLLTPANAAACARVIKLCITATKTIAAAIMAGMIVETVDCEKDNSCGSGNPPIADTPSPPPPPDKKHCEALRQSILNTCYGLAGRKRMACFEAANTSYRQCMGYE